MEGRSGQKEIGDAFGPQHARLVVAVAGNPHNYGVEFLFTKVVVFSLGAFDELGFRHEFDKSSRHLVYFSNPITGGAKCWITAETVEVRFLGKAYLGPRFELGFEIPNEQVIGAVPVEDDWRQCGNCQHVWQVAGRVKTSRCPNCNILTRLGVK